MVATLLGSAGYEVSYAQSVAEGLRLARRGGFALILLDWVFEDGTGLELCQMIRAFDTDTPIVFYSGVAYRSRIKEAMSAGAQGFLVKPVPYNDLVTIPRPKEERLLSDVAERSVAPEPECL